MALNLKTVRVGNKVKNVNGNDVIVKPHFLSSLDRFDGIHISEYYLNRLRFHRGPNPGSWWRAGNAQIKIFESAEGYYYVENFPNGKIEYVHQLQNLIFDLLNEETEEFDQELPKPVLKPGRG